MKKLCRKGHLYKSGKRSLALLLSVCLIGTMIPITARAESGSTETGLCEHHTEHTTECGYVAPTEGQECSHVHDESCGYQEAGECTHVHTEECGENGENCAHEHTSECGYAEGHACEHVHDEECGYAESSVGSPCTYVCDICGEEAKLDEKIGTNENLSEQTVGKLIAAETYKVVSSNILSEYNTSFEEVDDRGNLCWWNDASWEQTNIPRRAYGEAAKPAADCGDYYVQANPANIGDKAQCQIGDAGIAALIKGGKTYEYSYYAKLAEGEPTGVVTLSVIGDWLTCAEMTPDKEVTLNEYEWQKVTGTFTLASDASSIIVVRFEGTEGVAYCIDDLRIGNTASLTDQSGTELTGNDWWAQSVTFTAPDGFTISDNLTGTYESFFTYDTQTSAEGATVTYYLKNSDGEIAEKTAIVHIDKTVPNWNGDNCGISIKENWWKLLLENISSCMFYKETVDVKVCASDSLSGVAAYYYYIDCTGGTVKTAEQLDALNFTKYTGSVSGQNPTVTVTSLAPDGNYIVYAYAVDAAGNRSAYVCSEGVVVDNTTPAISNIVAPSKATSTLTDTTATISFTGSEAGTYFYMIKESSETAPTTITDFATEQANDGYSTWTANANISSATMTADADNKITLSDLKANTEYTLYIAAVDQAGNSIQTIASQNFTTCKTMPKVADADMPKISGTYGQTVAEMTLTNGVAKVGSDVITGTWAVTDSNKANVPAVGTTDTYQVTFTPTDSRYESVIVQVTPTVKQKPITVTAEDKTKTYGNDNPLLTFTVPDGALVGTDTKDALGVTLSCEATAVSPVKEGGYAITGTSSSANYDVTVTPGTLTINKADNAPNMPSSTMNVANSCTKVSDVTLPTGWVWQDADKDTALTVGTAVTATAEYNGADKGNYENETVSVSIIRSACDHAHTEVRNAKEATCKETGYTGDTYCKDCGELLTSGTTIPLADHQGGTATCTKKAVCTVCSKEYGTLDANNHVHTEIRGAVAATCTAGGYNGDTYCTDCGVKIKTGTATPALGHNYTGKVTTEPTTDREGVRTYTCDRCGHSYTESIPTLPEEPHEHSYSGSVTKEATCTDTGVRTYSCSCGDSYTETIPALGHHYVSSVTKQPTTSSEGVMTYTCDRCGHSYTRAIAKLQDTNNNNSGENQPSQTGDIKPGDNKPEENKPGAENKPDTGKPYIKDENGKEGWEVIKDEVDKTKDGDTVTVEMNGSAVVPGNVLDELKGKDTTIVFDMGGGITWSVNGQSITNDKIGDIDFSVTVGTNTIPVDVINNVTGERYSQQISLAYDGEFGFTAVLSINMEASNAGLYANLFYFNEKTGELEFICADEIAADGTAELTFTHASDYAIVIDKDPMDVASNEAVGTNVDVSGTASESQDTETEATQTGAEGKSDTWNPWWIIVIGIMVIVIGVGVFFVVKKKEELE